MEISVIICAHNPRRDYFHRALDSLRNQTISRQCWELIIVDNSSNVPIAAEWDISWHPYARHISEGELGLASARRRGIRSAAADLLVFVDDDNVLSPDYLAHALRIGREWPILGAWGSGTTIPIFEEPPPKNLEKWLELRDTKRTYWSNVPFSPEATPWGAGLCVRAKVAAEYSRRYEESSIRVTDRRGDLLWGGGDTEICVVACNIGFGVAVFPELRLMHLTPRERVTREYVLKQIEGNAASSVLLYYKWGGIPRRSPASLLGLMLMVKNLALHRGLDRWVHFARWRGTLKAKRLLDASQAESGLRPR